MPELPEVENICRALSPLLVGRSFSGVEIFTAKMRTPLAPLRDAPIRNSPVTALRRRGRYLIAELANGHGILMHFGMSGSVRIAPPLSGEPRRRHEHIVISLDNGETLRFECPRRFSLFEAVTLPAPGRDPEKLAGLGPEPLTGDFNGKYLFRVFSARKAPVKVLLMDNRVVVGVGNIYATESLAAAGISPLRPAGDMTRGECETLCREVKRILALAVEAGGSTIRDYRHVDGTPGEFARELAFYGHGGEPCPRCGTVMKCVRLGGRSSVYCPRCQK